MGNVPRMTKKQKKSDEKKPDLTTISLLVNSIYFFLQCVFIIKAEDGYRLVALHNGKVLTDITYDSLRGARIAFSKLYGNKAWEEDVKAQWSHFYDPDSRWLAKKIGGI